MGSTTELERLSMCEVRNWRVIHYLLALVLMTPIALSSLLWAQQQSPTTELSEYFIRGGIPTLNELHESLGSTCSSSLVDTLELDPCYKNRGKITLQRCLCGSNKLNQHSSASYIIPGADEALTYNMSTDTIANDLIVTFIDTGDELSSELLKYLVFLPASKFAWDGAAFGTLLSWSALGAKWPTEKHRSLAATSKVPSSHRSLHGGPKPMYLKSVGTHQNLPTKTRKARYIRCGKFLFSGSQVRLLRPYIRMKGCNLRAVWGVHSLGLCEHFPGRDCMYLTVLQDPVERMLHKFELTCKQTKPMKTACSSPVVFTKANKHLYPSFVKSFTRGCDQRCGTDVALANLKHNCVRYLLHDKLQHGLVTLGETIGNLKVSDEVQQRIIREASNFKISNSFNVEPGVREAIAQEIAHDVTIYKQATLHYEAQWKLPLGNCNAVE